MSEYKEYIAGMTYQDLQNQVSVNTSDIKALKGGTISGGGSGGSTASVTNSTGMDAIAVVRSDSSLGLLKNPTTYTAVPMLARSTEANPSRIYWKTASPGAGNAGGIPLRNSSNGHIRVPTIANKAGISAALKDGGEAVDVALSINSLINLTENSAINIAKGTTKTINIERRGLYVVRGGLASIAGMNSETSKCHIILFFQSGGNGKVLHLWTQTLGLGSEIIDYTPTTMEITNADSEASSWIIHTGLSTV